MTTINDLAEQQNQFKQELEFVKQAIGLCTDWLTPNQAEKILPISKARILREIAIAEKLRGEGRKHDLKYGRHYYNIAFSHDLKEGEIVDLNLQRPSWKIHREKFWEVVSRPPDERAL